MTDYGVLFNVVANAGYIAAAALAIKIVWMKRSQWQPPEEAVPDSVARFSVLSSGVLIVILYFINSNIGTEIFAAITFSLLLISIISLSTAIYVNKNYSFFYPTKIEKNRFLGGQALTKQALDISVKKHQTLQQMIDHAQGDRDLIWTKESQAKVQLKSALSYISLISFGTASLAAASMLLIKLSK
jgi:hypothetical protein